MKNTREFTAPARIEGISIRNYRALRNVTFSKLAPLTVLVGPNGSGKSTVFDVFAFLSECFSVGLRKAWDKRGRFKELRSRDAQGPIEFELKYREPTFPIVTYHLEVNEDSKGPYVAKEWLRWTRGIGKAGRPFNFLYFEDGNGYALPGEKPSKSDSRVEEKLASREYLAINTLGQFEKHPRVSALRRFITGWHLSYLTADNTRGIPEAGPQERLSQTGDNLPNVIQYLREQHPDRLGRIFDTLRRRVPRLEKVDAELLTDGRLLLQIKDAPFDRPILARYASDGTLKMLAYLVALYDPTPPPLIGIEEPENHLHPRLLPELAEECRTASAQTQLMVTTHSPFFLNGLKPEEAWVLYRNEKGFTTACRVAEIRGVQEFVQHGAKLGHLWMEGHFQVGDPLTRSGEPADLPQDKVEGHAR
jgi:predicted ATPase